MLLVQISVFKIMYISLMSDESIKNVLKLLKVKKLVINAILHGWNSKYIVVYVVGKMDNMTSFIKCNQNLCPLVAGGSIGLYPLSVVAVKLCVKVFCLSDTFGFSHVINCKDSLLTCHVMKR